MSDRGSGDQGEPVVPPLEWMSGWMEDQPATVPGSRQPWGPDAASSPLTYWHWREQRRLASAAAGMGGELQEGAPTLSIVVPVRQPALPWLRQCLRSVVDQTYVGWELWLCDAGSEPSGWKTATQSVIDAGRAGTGGDSRVHMVVPPRPGGVSAAINEALAQAHGEFVVRLDEGDVLEPNALEAIAARLLTEDDVDVLYCDEDRFSDIERPVQPYFKPDWDPDLLLATAYLGHALVIRTALLRAIGGYRSEYDGSHDYDVMLRATEQARQVAHLPEVLYHRRIGEHRDSGPREDGGATDETGRRALESALARRGIDGVVERGPFAGAHHLRRKVTGTPTVSVIIPFRDQAALTVACLASLEVAPGHPIAETVLIDNGSTEPETRALRSRLGTRSRTRVLDYPGPFNWAAINNMAAATCSTDLVLFMNNDIEAASDRWLASLVELAQRSEVGAVAPRLLYPDGKVQHAGVVLGLGGIAMHLFAGLPPEQRSYFGWDRVVRGYSALTGACLLIRREVFEQMGGFNEALPVAFNDIDFCIRLGQAGYRLLYTPHAQLTHYESVSRGRSGFTTDFATFLALWWDHLRQDDPAYNPNLGRFAPWCPIRMPGEDERWLAEVGSMVPGG